ncbi:HPr family phosphocarrier protein [Candidatus Woesearchaeota archaeon]|nr:HPr family phosphocarrier protein [Candidatus Woesearchaeota archaeon]
MVERIIERCIADGFFQKQELGCVYAIPEQDNLLAVNCEVGYEGGMHARPVNDFMKRVAAQEIDRAYLVDTRTGLYGHSRSVLSLLGMATPAGSMVTVVANHDATPEKLMAIYAAMRNGILLK